MSLIFNFDKYKAVANPKQEVAKQDDADDITKFESAPNARSLYLIASNGVHSIISYSQLPKADFHPAENKIELNFLTHTVTLTGNNLEKLFEAFQLQLPKRIVCLDKRYQAIKEENDTYVTDIVITKNE